MRRRLIAQTELVTIIDQEQFNFDGTKGDLVTLLPIGGPALSVSTKGLRFPLEGEDLSPFSARGVSNEMTGTRAEVGLEHGVLAVIHLPTSDVD